MIIEIDLWADRYPHFSVNLKGMTVTHIISSHNDDELWVTIKEPIEGAEEYDNAVMFDKYDHADDILYLKTKWQEFWDTQKS